MKTIDIKNYNEQYKLIDKKYCLTKYKKLNKLEKDTAKKFNLSLNDFSEIIFYYNLKHHIIL